LSLLSLEQEKNPTVKSFGLNDEFVRVRDVPEERRRGLNEDPMELPNDNTILSTVNAPLFTTPPSNDPVRLFPKRSIAVLLPSFDFNVVPVKSNLTDSLPDDVITFTSLPVDTFKCPVAFDTVKHGYDNDEQ
jgi:hypothetical protein